MSRLLMGALEAKFADIIWEKAPVSASELARIAIDVFGWKKPTTYTVIKRLCDKGIFENNDGIVSVILTHDDYYTSIAENIIDAFDGSVPAFVAAFTKKKALSPDDVAKLRQMVEEYEEA